MKTKKLFLLLGLLLSSISIQAQWIQTGQDIDGEATNDESGYSVSLNSNGLIMAVGAYSNGGNGTFSGHVRIYQNNEGTWTQIGDDIDSLGQSYRFGTSVSLSSDGSIVAIGGPFAESGYVGIYQNISGTWTQIGQNILGESTGDWFGRSVSISSDGSMVAIGAPNSLNENGIGSGHVRIYQNNGGNWIQLGQDIDGETSFESFGFSISLSSDGSIVAIGGSGFNGANGSFSGHVQIYQNNGGNWTQLGNDIDGEAEFDSSGLAVSLNSDGTIVAIGAPSNDGSFSNAGHVRIYQNNASIWTQIGQDIDGENINDNFGSSVSLSSDGSTVVIGGPFNDGHVGTYKNNSGTWIQIGDDIDGEASEDFSGFSTSINSDGTVIAIGAPGNDGNGNNSGQVRVYQNENLGISEFSQLEKLIYPNPTSGIIYLEFISNNTPQVSIFDLTGKLIYDKLHSISNNKLKIDFSNFESGIYLIKIKENNKIFTGKVIKD
jgi:hypothetical protein